VEAAKLTGRVKRRSVSLGGGVSTRVVVYENEGIGGVNDGGFENFPEDAQESR
jgi:hypothetical protein